MPKSEPIVTLDLGGTNLRVALMDRRARVLARASELTRAEEGPERVAQRIAGIAGRLLAEQGVERPLAVGAALASPLDKDGVMLYPPSLGGWKAVPFRALLARHFSVPVCTGNDATLAALGEHVFGAARGVDDLVYLTISTGVGGGVITGGKLLLGTRGLAAELGHIIIDKTGPPHPCGHAGCLESLVSGTAIARRGAAAVRDGRSPGILALAGSAEAVRAEHVFQAAAQGDRGAGDLAHAVAHEMGLGIASCVHVFNPRLVILGGGVMRNWPALRDEVVETVRRTVMPGFFDGLEITTTRFGDDVGMVGAVALVLQELGGRGPARRRGASAL